MNRSINQCPRSAPRVRRRALRARISTHLMDRVPPMETWKQRDTETANASDAGDADDAGDARNAGDARDAGDARGASDAGDE